MRNLLHQKTRFISSQSVLVVWRWLFNLSLLSLIFIFLLNRYQLVIRLRLASGPSLFSNFWLLLLALTCILLLTSIVHELGHLLAGRLARLRFQMLMIGPIQLARIPEGVRVRWRWQGSLFNGLAASLPQQQDRLGLRMLLFALGGPAASLVLTFAAVSLAFYLDGSLNQLNGPLWLWEGSGVTAVISYFFFLTAIKPGSYANGLPADGARILMLLQQGAEARRWRALVQLHSADSQGQRPSAWPESLLQQALAYPDETYDHLTALMMGYQHALDRGDVHNAEAFLAQGLESRAGWETGMRARFLLEQAYMLAHYKEQAAAAREVFNQIRGKSQGDSVYLRAKTAVLMGEGKMAEATAVADAAQKLLPNSPYTGLQKAEVDWLQQLWTKTDGNTKSLA